MPSAFSRRRALGLAGLGVLAATAGCSGGTLPGSDGGTSRPARATCVPRSSLDAHRSLAGLPLRYEVDGARATFWFDGAFFGRTFGSLFLLTFPDYDLTRRGSEVLSNTLSRVVGNEPTLNGLYEKNIAPGLGAGRIYEPKIYGFRVSERARSGPRMQWLRERPSDIKDLDEARLFAEQNPDSEDDDESMNANGRVVVRRRAPGNARTRQKQRQNGSPMALSTNGAESEL